MKRTLVVGLILGICFLSSCVPKEKGGCLTGAFLADRPSAQALEGFQRDFGKKPFLILTFLDWGKFPDEAVIRDVYGAGSVLMITWEPWHALQKAAIDYDAVLDGRDDAYISGFALKLKAIGRPVFLRFAHEMNGDWYPWAGMKISPEKYQRLFRHARRIFDKAGASNVRWVFSINAENVPPKNAYAACYPGDPYVDYIGLDGYNWGTVRTWSRWRSFKDIFSGVYEDVVRHYKKPVILSEFGSTSSGGDKARWIVDALQEIKKMPAVKGFILFNEDKETDWRFPPHSASGQALEAGLEGPYFLEAREGDLG